MAKRPDEIDEIGSFGSTAHDRGGDGRTEEEKESPAVRILYFCLKRGRRKVYSKNKEI